MERGFNEQLLAQLKAGEQAISRVDYQEAEKIFRGAMELTQVDPENRLATADIIECLARVCSAAGRPLDARQYCEEVVKLRSEVWGIDHLDVARSKLSLAQACEKLGDLTEAAQQMREAFSVLRQSLGPQHQDTLNCLKRSIAIQDAIRRKEAICRDDVTWAG